MCGLIERTFRGGVLVNVRTVVGEVVEVGVGGGELDGGEGIADDGNWRVVRRCWRVNVSCWGGVTDDMAILHGCLGKRSGCVFHGDVNERSRLKKS